MNPPISKLNAITHEIEVEVFELYLTLSNSVDKELGMIGIDREDWKRWVISAALPDNQRLPDTTL